MDCFVSSETSGEAGASDDSPQTGSRGNITHCYISTSLDSIEKHLLMEVNENMFVIHI